MAACPLPLWSPAVICFGGRGCQRDSRCNGSTQRTADRDHFDPRGQEEEVFVEKRHLTKRLHEDRDFIAKIVNSSENAVTFCVTLTSFGFLAFDLCLEEVYSKTSGLSICDVRCIRSQLLPIMQICRLPLAAPSPLLRIMGEFPTVTNQL